MCIRLIKILFICWLFAPLQQAHALTTLNTTLASGYHRDSLKQEHLSLFYNMKYSYTSHSGIETYLDFGINNDFVQEEWGAYPYLLYLTLPLDKGQESAAFRKSRVQIGRQIFLEGFAFETLDGVVLQSYLRPDSGIIVYAGSLHVPEETTKSSFKEQIYGSNLFFNKKMISLKVGPAYKTNANTETYLFNSNALILANDFWSHPMLSYKQEWNFKDKSVGQELAEVRAAPIENISMGLQYSSRRPDPNFSRKRRLIYNLFAVGYERSRALTLDWDMPTHQHMGARTERIEYESVAGKENGESHELNYSFDLGSASISPSVRYLSSFGGEMWDYHCRFSYGVNQVTHMSLEAEMSKLDKLNSITGYAYNARAGLDLEFLSRWKAQALLEIERNHLFKVDSRLVIYASHFYY